MKFSCNKQDLVDAINIVQKAVMTKATIPILEGVFIEANDCLKLVGNCYDMGIECSVDADIKEEGTIVLNSRMFGDIVRRLPNAEVFIQVKPNFNVIIECDNSYFEIKGLSAEGYPMLPTVEEEQKVTLSQTSLRNMIRKTIYAISSDDNRKILTGSLLEANDGDLSMVALDGFRLAVAKIMIKENTSFKAVIPGKNLNEIHKILEQNDKEVKITLSKNQALFELEQCRIISKLLDGEFMNYKSFIPEQFETNIVVDVSDIVESIERASLITSDDKRYPVKFSVEDTKMLITSNTDVGISKEEIIVNVNGNNMTIGFNPKYLLDSLKVADEKEVKIYFSSAVGPCIIRPCEGDSFLFMILPVRIK